MARSAAGVNRVYAYAGCSTCRKALAWLRDRGISFEVIDITTTPPSAEQLRQALDQLGGRSRLFNTSGKSYRELGAATVKAMDDDQAVAALAADGRLIRRPFLVSATGAILTGFTPGEWEASLVSPLSG
jgi:arsenate reductase